MNKLEKSFTWGNKSIDQENSCLNQVQFRELIKHIQEFGYSYLEESAKYSDKEETFKIFEEHIFNLFLPISQLEYKIRKGLTWIQVLIYNPKDTVTTELKWEADCLI